MSEYIFPSDNGFEFLEGYFKRLYGELGSFQRILARYVSGYDFCTANRIIKKPEDIPLITKGDIDNIILYENKKKEAIRDFISKYEEAKEKDKLNERNYLYLASLLGVVPFICPDSDPIYCDLLNTEHLSEAEISAMRQGVQAQPNVVAVMVDMLYHGFKDGMIVRIADKGRKVWHQGNCVNYYRGEPAFYGSSRASIYRTRDGRAASREKVLIRMINLVDFSLLLRQIPYIEGWPFGDVFYPGIAQHYGMPTPFLDITGDFRVALFFACTKWDRENKTWRPLSREDFDPDKDARGIRAMGGDPRYAVIYRAPAGINNLCAVNNTGRSLTPVYPMGYQPFLRCEKQNAYYVTASIHYDMYSDPTFEKFRFELSEDVCERIFNEMRQGRDIYPRDISGDCSEMIDLFARGKVYSETALDIILEDWGITAEKNELISAFDGLGYTMRDKPDPEVSELIDRYERSFVKNKGYEMFNQRDCFFKPMFCM